MPQTLAVPPHTALLRDFVNTLDVETGEEALTSPDALTRWLAEQNVIAAGTRATADDHEHALRLRETLRGALVGHHDDVAAHDALDAECAAYPIRVSLRTGSPTLDPVRAGVGVSGGLTRIVTAIVASDADGTWSRLKVCPEESCQWAFVDTSKNRSRTWCTMRVCGNRSKTRAYRERRARAAPAASERRNEPHEDRERRTRAATPASERRSE